MAVGGLFFLASLMALIMLEWVFFHLFFTLWSLTLTSLYASASVPFSLCSLSSNVPRAFLALLAQISFE